MTTTTLGRETVILCDCCNRELGMQVVADGVTRIVITMRHDKEWHSTLLTVTQKYGTDITRTE